MKKVKVKTEPKNKLWKHIPADNITELNDLIYVGAKLVTDKIVIPLRNPNRNNKKKPWWEISLEVLIKKLRQEKVRSLIKHKGTQRKAKTIRDSHRQVR